MAKDQRFHWCKGFQFLKPICCREFALNYGFALFAVATATYLRVQLEPVLGDRLPMGMHTLAIGCAAWICGPRPAILALIASALCAAYYIMPPHNSLYVFDSADQFSTALFVAIGVILISLFSRLEYQRNIALANAAENETLNVQLSEVDRRKDEFLSLLAHELRSPMAPIGNAIRLTERLVDHSLQRKSLLLIMSRNFKHMVRLVDDLLDVSRYLRGSIQLKREVTSLNGCVRDAVEMNKSELFEKGHELSVDLPKAEVLAFADPVRCTQIVCNLLSNAIKYTPEHGIIRVILSVNEESIQIAIKDNGLGIPDSIRDQIFEPFFQANPKQTRFASGMGLGLSIVRKLAELHGGSIEIDSRGTNTGSRFSVHFPLDIVRDAPDQEANTTPKRVVSKSQAAVASTRSFSDFAELDFDSSSRLANKETRIPQNSDGNISGIDTISIGQQTIRERDTNPVDHKSNGGSLRILVADDDVDTANTLSQLLQFEGHQTETANDGLAAIEKCRSFQPQVLLLDIGLPEMNGFQVARQLRTTKFGQRLKIVAISGWGAESDKIAGIEAGFDAHLVKPVSLDELAGHLCIRDETKTG